MYDENLAFIVAKIHLLIYDLFHTSQILATYKTSFPFTYYLIGQTGFSLIFHCRKFMEHLMESINPYALQI